jgi:anaerobic magnesium-protoporphyrin IX monomethyl ester cyclase
MKITLMHPPLDDPTIPYHSMAYLAGHLSSNGFPDVSIRDVNIEFVNYCLEENTILFFKNEMARRLKEFESKSLLSLSGQEEYYGLWSGTDSDGAGIQKAAEGLRDKEKFLDFELYKKDVKLLSRYFRSLGALAYPSEISNFRHMSRGRYSIYNMADLINTDLREKICYPFTIFFQDRLANDPRLKQTDCFGISIVYDHQLVYALYLASALRRTWPDKLIVLGGTSISQLYKYLKDKSRMKAFFDVCDAIVVGEGETAICEIAQRDGYVQDANIPNTITYDAKTDRVRFPAHIHYENVNSLGKPLYNYQWDLYLSPERGINYAPTRGCYWNRCTFCDYGLNTDRPTSPWRERNIDRVIEDLKDALLT